MVRINRSVLFSLFFMSMIVSAQASSPELTFSDVLGDFTRSLFLETKCQVQIASNLDGTPVYKPAVLQPMFPLQEMGRKASSLWSYTRSTPKSTIAKALIEDVTAHPLERLNLACFLIGEETHAAVMVISYGASCLSQLKHYFGMGSDLLVSLMKGTSVSDSTMQSLVLISAAAILIPKVEALPYSYAGSAKSCELPTGSYLHSCSQSSSTIYKSTDQNVPGDMCSLVTLCKTMYDGLPLKRNSFIYAHGDRVELGNNNGTLVLISKIPGVRPSLTECKLPEGSYKQTCHVRLEPYITSDRNLASATMCHLIAECRKLVGWSQTSVKKVVHSYQLGRLENCDGILVHHLASSLDGSCEGKSAETIRRVAGYHKYDEL